MSRLLPFRTVPVLAYHHVAITSRNQDPLGLAVTPARFEAQMRHLHEEGFRTLSPEAFATLLQSGAKAPPRCLLISFDDGYLNNYTEAFPILTKYGCTATIFVVTDCLGKTNIWDASEQMKLMSWSHVDEMKRTGISFQSHTRSHPDLTTVPEQTILSELAGSRGKIEDATGNPACFLAYPYGRCDGRSMDLAERTGYRFAFGAGMLPPGPFSLERLQITGRDADLAFRLKISGWASWIRVVLHALRAATKKPASKRCTVPGYH